MRCIPTCVALSSDDPEFAAAMDRLVDRLGQIEARIDAATESVPEGQPSPWHLHQWRYVGSAPFREDDGSIIYVHGFQHSELMMADEPLVLGIPASTGWWPSGHRSLSPQRTAPRAKLRLVS